MIITKSLKIRPCPGPTFVYIISSLSLPCSHLNYCEAQQVSRWWSKHNVTIFRNPIYFVASGWRRSKLNIDQSHSSITIRHTDHILSGRRLWVWSEHCQRWSGVHCHHCLQSVCHCPGDWVSILTQYLTPFDLAAPGNGVKYQVHISIYYWQDHLLDSLHQNWEPKLYP